MLRKIRFKTIFDFFFNKKSGAYASTWGFERAEKWQFGCSISVQLNIFFFYSNLFFNVKILEKLGHMAATDMKRLMTVTGVLCVIMLILMDTTYARPSTLIRYNQSHPFFRVILWDVHFYETLFHIHDTFQLVRFSSQMRFANVLYIFNKVSHFFPIYRVIHLRPLYWIFLNFKWNIFFSTS